MELALALTGAAPALAAMFYVDRIDKKRPEPRSTLRRVAIAGALSTLPCFAVEVGLQQAVTIHAPIEGVLFLAFVIAAAVEETAKAICFRFTVWDRPEFDERLDGIVYATRAGLGFALLENIKYLWDARSGALLIYVERALLAIPLHAIATGFMGYFAARRRFDKVGPGIVGGWLLAVLLHGAYDATAIGSGIAALEHKSTLAVALLGGPILIVLAGGISLRRAAARALALDDQAEAQGRLSRAA
jgi:RsiW-degrading membrane proteinase PrsW (M82 family)